MRKIIEYGIRRGGTALDLIEKVNESIGEGWQPFGNPTAIVGGAWTQPIVRYADPEPANGTVPCEHHWIKESLDRGDPEITVCIKCGISY